MLNRKGQNVAEYSILIALVIGAAVAMQVYVKRGFQGRVRDAVDNPGAAVADVGGQALTWTGEQYEPYYQKSEFKVKSARNVTETVGVNSQINKTGVDEGTIREKDSYEETLAPSTATP